MRRWGEEKPAKARIEIIPMIDVMMFLLVFFVLISINVIPALGIRTVLPQSVAPDQLEPRKHIVITLTADGMIQIDGQTVDITLLGALLLERKGNDKLDVTINGDEGVTLQQLVDVFDVLKRDGFESVSIATEKRTQ